MSSTSELLVNVSRIVAKTDAEGPGTRFAVWVQGCSIQCKGCFNPHLWSPFGGNKLSPSHLADKALSSNSEGITLLGGEPFEQADSLSIFAEMVRNQGMSVMTFTGYTLPVLQRRATNSEGISKLLAATDLLVDGPYVANQIDNQRPWVGSRNQQFHFLTDRYSELEDRLSSLPDRLEIRIGSDGSVQLNGWLSPEQLGEVEGWLDSPFGRD